MSERDELIHGLGRHLRRRLQQGERKLPAGEAQAAAPAPAHPSGSPGAHKNDHLVQDASPLPATEIPRPGTPPRPAPQPVAASRSASEARNSPPESPGEGQSAAARGSGLFSFDGQDGLASQARKLRERAAAAPDLASLAREVADCSACDLCQTRTQTVFMDGQGSRRVLFVGEAPGFHEDRQGVPFVGAAGQLLTDIIEKGMKIRREEVSIANVLKCRPPENRDPKPQEKALCTAWLDRQIELIDPEVIVGLGRHAAGHLLGREDSLGRMRGQVHERGGRKIVATYHPAYLLRNPGSKKDTWKDIQEVMRLLGLL